jgi:hypothetical protein
VRGKGVGGSNCRIPVIQERRLWVGNEEHREGPFGRPSGAPPRLGTVTGG